MINVKITQNSYIYTEWLRFHHHVKSYMICALYMSSPWQRICMNLRMFSFCAPDFIFYQWVICKMGADQENQRPQPSLLLHIEAMLLTINACYQSASVKTENKSWTRRNPSPFISYIELHERAESTIEKNVGWVCFPPPLPLPPLSLLFFKMCDQFHHNFNY